MKRCGVTGRGGDIVRTRIAWTMVIGDGSRGGNHCEADDERVVMAEQLREEQRLAEIEPLKQELAAVCRNVGPV